MPSFDIVIVSLAAPIVPEDTRRDWQREWGAELEWARRHGKGTLRRSVRAAGAWPHACWLRYDRWRFEMLWNDLKYALRTLAKRPGFAIVAILTLAVGIGANAAIFSAVQAVLLRPLPFPDPDRLVTIPTTTVERPDRLSGSTSPPDFTDWRRDTRSFAEMAAIVAGASALTGSGAAEQVPSANVTGGFFEVLGVQPLHGRPLQTIDDPIGASDVAVLGYGLWTRRFGRSPDVVGTTVTIDSRTVRIVGVMPEGFSYPLGTELWVPLRFTEDDLRTQRGAQYLDVIARLAPAATLEGARVEIRAYAKQLADLYPRYNDGRTAAVHIMRDAMVGDVRPALLLMLGAVGFVLLIVCVNVANLVLTRALGRQRELAVRTALGAGKARLVRGLLVESAMLAAAGGAAGLAVAVWATRAMSAIDRGINIPLLDQTRVDGAVATFTVGVSALAALLFGTLPAWQASSRLDVVRRIREDGGTTTGDRHRQRLRSALIVAETALAVMLLVGAGLLMRSFLGLAAVDLGIRASGVQTFNLSLPEPKYPTPVARAAAIDDILARIRTHPDVETAGAIFGLPLTNFGYSISMSTLDSRNLDDKEQMERLMQVRIVTPDYFRTMGIPLRRGRLLTEADRLGTPLVMLVNETAAARLWPTADPLGHEFTLGTQIGDESSRAGGMVVGVVGDVRDGGPARPGRPTVYFPHAQRPIDFVTVVVKSRGEPTALIDPLRRALAAFDPDLPIYRVRTMDQIAGSAVAQPRLFLTLLGLFAGAALLLAAIGIYGVLSITVSQRTREIGLRLALGADRGSVVRMVVRQAMTLALAGLVIGLGLAVGASRLMQGLLFGIEPVDAVTYALVAVTFAIVASVASTLPARRASRVDPIAALRSE
jgi:predicted permease